MGNSYLYLKHWVRGMHLSHSQDDCWEMLWEFGIRKAALMQLLSLYTWEPEV